MANVARTATRSLASIPFGSVIGGPLVAAVEAQAKAAETTVEFVEEVGLEPNYALDDDGELIPEVDANGDPVLDEDGYPVYQLDPDNPYTTRTLTFLYESAGNQVDLVVPLLAVVPIPYIRIDTLSINFKANISAEANFEKTRKTSVQTDGSASGKYKKGGLFSSGSVSFDASVSAKKDSTASADSKYSVEYTMDVSLHAVQDEIPAGMTKVLNILTESITRTYTVSGITLTSGGSGYTGPPTVELTGGGGSGATATVSFDSTSGEVTGITITDPGSGYTAAPSVVFTGGGGSGAAATATIS